MTILLALILAAPIQYPRKEGVVNDYAGILDPASRSKIEQSLRGLQAAKNFVMVLVTVKSLDGQSIEEYGVGLANAWKIGEKGKNNGIVFLIAPHEHKVRIENGYGTEGTLTDIESKLLMEETVVPLFKEGKLSQGILAGTDAIVAKLGGTAPLPARAPPAGIPTKEIIIGVVVLIVILIILMSFEGSRFFLMALLDAATSSNSSSGSSSSSSSSDDSDSSSGGGSFGGGGATSSW